MAMLNNQMVNICYRALGFVQSHREITYLFGNSRIELASKKILKWPDTWGPQERIQYVIASRWRFIQIELYLNRDKMVSDGGILCFFSAFFVYLIQIFLPDSAVLPWWYLTFQGLWGLKTYDLREATTPDLGVEEGWLRMLQIWCRYKPKNNK
jgi:hypothetical protein